jgi:hypothetical protein
MKLIISICISVITTFSFAQKYQFDYNFGEFKNASSFYINPAGIIYVSDSNTNEIFSFDTSGNVQKEIGGFGWRESAFDEPVDIFADALKVFVADKNNHRIQRFDKNLNFNFQISTRDAENEQESFGYPLSAVMSNQGDIYILDSENSRIVKFDIFGTFIQNFGSYDYGKYALSKPKQLAISNRNNIYVIDGKQIIIFDQYGNGIGKISGVEDFTSIRIIFEWMTVSTVKKIFLANLNSPDMSLKEITFESTQKVPEEIKSSFIFNDKLYILSKEVILVFKKI